MAFTLTSPALGPGGRIPAERTCDGADTSPELRWSGVPGGTLSFALTMHDPDAPGGVFTHWVLFDIPPDAKDLQAGLGAAAVGVPGTNDFDREGYGGPCPPAQDGDHRYVFTLYALDVENAGLELGARRSELEAAIRDRVLDTAELVEIYRRA